jgi:uncharacterized protein with PIN domain
VYPKVKALYSIILKAASLLMSEQLDICSKCEKGFLEPEAEVVIEGVDPERFRSLSGKRIFQCDNCGQRYVEVGDNQYIKLEDNIVANAGIKH